MRKERENGEDKGERRWKAVKTIKVLVSFSTTLVD